MSALSSGTLLKHGEFRIGKVLGQGGFGITYEAEQVSLGRKVAVKEFFMKDLCYRDESTSHVSVPSVGSKELVERFRQKFIREARTIAGLDHNHIVRIYDVFEENGTAYYVMEYLSGGSLDRKIRECGALSEEKAVGYIRQIADALHYLHSRSILHFDVKPSNVLLNENGIAKLIDFGISKHYDESGCQTSSTPVGISKGFAPLEQYQQGGDIKTFTPATDIYALGATLCALVVGCNPPEASVIYEDGVPSIKGISKSVMRAIKSAMRPKRKDRPQNVSEFLRILDAGKSAIAVADESTVVVGPKENTPRKRCGGSSSLSRKNSVKSKPKSGRSKRFVDILDELLVEPLLFILELVLKVLPYGIACCILYYCNQDTIEPVLSDAFHFVKNINSTTTGRKNGHEWVDLGLSVKWATCNVGASSPGEYGSYFAWGETSPKSSYGWENLKYRTSGDSYDNVKFSKYVSESKYGTVDNKNTLDLSDDAARTNWGKSWRMPTRAEQDELREKCSWTWTTQDGHNGYKVTSSVNGNSIFLPAAGYWNGDILYGVGLFGEYGSSSLVRSYPYNAWSLAFGSNNRYKDYSYRNHGRTVRPVCPY